MTKWDEQFRQLVELIHKYTIMINEKDSDKFIKELDDLMGEIIDWYY